MPFASELRDFCTWLLAQHGSTNAGSDPNGAIVMTQNHGKNPWFIPGTWNLVGQGRRRIKVPSGTRLFIVAASSHATPNELPVGTPHTRQTLQKQAEDVFRSWLHATVATGNVNGPLKQLRLTIARTGVFSVDIHPGSQYAAITGVSGNGIDMACVARVNMFKPPKGVSRITIAGQAPQVGIGAKGEDEYNMHVTYEVTVP